MKRFSILQLAAIGFVAVDALHFIDHQRQGRVLSVEVYSIGSLGLLAALAVLVLALRRHPVAPFGAAAFGTAAAIGVALVHLAPQWSVFSDSYIPLRLDMWSWVSADLLLAAAAALAAAGFSTLRSTSGTRSD